MVLPQGLAEEELVGIVIVNYQFSIVNCQIAVFFFSLLNKSLIFAAIFVTASGPAE